MCNLLGEETYQNSKRLSAELDVDSDMGVRLYLDRNASGQWATTPHRQFGNENFTIFSFEGCRIKQSWLLHFNDVKYAQVIEDQMNDPHYGQWGDSRPALYF
jgi:hypothetical protein